MKIVRDNTVEPVVYTGHLCVSATSVFWGNSPLLLGMLVNNALLFNAKRKREKNKGSLKAPASTALLSSKATIWITIPPRGQVKNFHCLEHSGLSAPPNTLLQSFNAIDLR
uniref:Uncharacterized protein n=1 Tax=Coccidioides posadasii RMSCC 3488 TaxID=454284 RepID=A0A0J6FFT9_COCPO|nr:hypothetical protein CPAG_04516 [Coccidioides posadasii RMSCC 3488]